MSYARATAMEKNTAVAPRLKPRYGTKADIRSIVKKREAEAAARGIPRFDNAVSEQRPLSQSSFQRQSRMRKVWNTFIEDEGQLRGLSKATHTVRPNFTPPTLDQMKHFCRYIAKATRGHIEDIPTITTVRIYLAGFCEYLLAAGNYVLSPYAKDQLSTFVHHTLLREELVTGKEWEKRAFKWEDKIVVQRTLWTQLDSTPVMISGRRRIIVTALLHLFCYTGGRRGAFLPAYGFGVQPRNLRIQQDDERDDAERISDGRDRADQRDAVDDVKEDNLFEESRSKSPEKTGLRYRDITFELSNVNSKPEFVMTVSQRFFKNNKDTENNALVNPLLFHEDCLTDAMPWILALCFADGVFRDYLTPEKLWAQIVPANRAAWKLRYKEEFLDWHVFRPHSASREPFTVQHFEAIWKPLMRQSAYPEHVRIHRIRQEVSMVVDASGASALEHQHLLGQSKKVALSHYKHNVTSIDVQSLYIGEEQRVDHIRNLQGIGRTRISGIPVNLPPSKRMHALENSGTLKTLRRYRESIVANGQDVTDIDSEISTTRQKVLAEAYNAYLSEWIEQDYQLSLGCLGSREFVKDAVQEARFQQYLACAPAHSRVAAALTAEDRKTQDRHLAMVLELVSLAKEETAQVHFPGERPVSGCCPVAGCSSNMTNLSPEKVKRHIHVCRQAEASRRNGGARMVYCYLCYDWMTWPRWKSHCVQHLQGPPTMDCGLFSISNMLVRPGLCPFCLVDTTSRAEVRWTNFTNQSSLSQHVRRHVGLIQSWPSSCPLPQCSQTKLHSRDEMEWHLIDVHRVNMHVSLKRKAPVEEVPEIDSQLAEISSRESSEEISTQAADGLSMLSTIPDYENSQWVPLAGASSTKAEFGPSRLPNPEDSRPMDAPGCSARVNATAAPETSAGHNIGNSSMVSPTLMKNDASLPTEKKHPHPPQLTDELIIMALLEAPSRQLRSGEICDWIFAKYPYFDDAEKRKACTKRVQSRLSKQNFYERDITGGLHTSQWTVNMDKLSVQCSRRARFPRDGIVSLCRRNALEESAGLAEWRLKRRRKRLVLDSDEESSFESSGA